MKLQKLLWVSLLVQVRTPCVKVENIRYVARHMQPKERKRTGELFPWREDCAGDRANVSELCCLRCEHLLEAAGSATELACSRHLSSSGTYE